MKDIKILNRILRITDKGLFYEADPRHVELLARALGLENSTGQFTPGSKLFDDDEVADGQPNHEDAVEEELHQFVNQLLAQPSLLARPSCSSPMPSAQRWKTLMRTVLLYFSDGRADLAPALTQ